MVQDYQTPGVLASGDHQRARASARAFVRRGRVRRRSAEVALVSARLRGALGGGVSPPDLPLSGNCGAHSGQMRNGSRVDFRAERDGRFLDLL